MVPTHVPLALTAQTAIATSFTGPGGGNVPGDAEYCVVTSSASTKILALGSDIPQGKAIWLNVGANGFKLQTAKSGETINNVDTSTSAVAVIPANTTNLVVKSLAAGFILTSYTALGAVGTAIVPA